MFATSNTIKYPAMAAGQQDCTSRAQRMHGCAPRTSAQAMCGTGASASATASILPLQTGVSASVSLFVLLLILGTLLLVGLSGLLGLTGLLSLSGLTGLVISLVGLLKGLSPGATTGD